MDAGLAAVLGALAGAVATTGAAFATGWSTREQARIAARAEHRRQRREPRREVYARFIRSATAVEEHIGPLALHTESERVRILSDEFYQELDRLVADLYEQRDAIMLAGPDLVSELGENVALRAMNVKLRLARWSLMGHPTDGDASYLREVGPQAQEYVDRLSAFSRAARNALDDDGTKR
ncbi:hypothetical protein [Streptomyces indiaensis]|uniref:hypothetical protein n=1 Tax=Streptomyces indiaensis TaxID=284033 RepID=UPI001F2C88CE|nr:hypothetical protein [Streptomyces indiaensis]MCF1648672.1 hypothetical protein [Streptomyces indiaensis]